MVTHCMRFVRNKTNICSVYNFLRGNTAFHTDSLFEKVAGAEALGGIEKHHGFEQPLIIMLALLHLNLTKGNHGLCPTFGSLTRGCSKQDSRCQSFLSHSGRVVESWHRRDLSIKRSGSTFRPFKCFTTSHFVVTGQAMNRYKNPISTACT